MSNEKRRDVRSWCNPRPGWARDAQLGRLTGEVYEVVAKDRDHGGAKRAAMIRSVRRGDEVQVCKLYLLALNTGRSDKQRRDLLEIVDKIEAKGGVIVEAVTSFRSDVPSQWRQMQADAFYELGRAGQGRRSALNGARSQGRPERFTREQKASMRQIWFSREHPTGEQAVAAMQAIGIKAKRTYCYNKFGPRNPRAADDI